MRVKITREAIEKALLEKEAVYSKSTDGLLTIALPQELYVQAEPVEEVCSRKHCIANHAIIGCHIMAPGMNGCKCWTTKDETGSPHTVVKDCPLHFEEHHWCTAGACTSFKPVEEKEPKRNHSASGHVCRAKCDTCAVQLEELANSSNKKKGYTHIGNKACKVCINDEQMVGICFCKCHEEECGEKKSPKEIVDSVIELLEFSSSRNGKEPTLPEKTKNGLRVKTFSYTEVDSILDSYCSEYNVVQVHVVPEWNKIVLVYQ